MNFKLKKFKFYDKLFFPLKFFYLKALLSYSYIFNKKFFFFMFSYDNETRTVTRV